MIGAPDARDRTTRRSASCRCRTSSSGWRLLMFSRGAIDRVRRVDRHGAARTCSEVRPTIVLVGAAPLREDVRARARERALRAARQEADLLLGARGRRTAGPTRSSRGASRRARSRCSTRSRSKLVFSKLQARTGGRLRYFVVAAARRSRRRSTSSSTRRGSMILEGYGLTETSPVIAVNTPEQLPHRHRRQADRRRRGEDRGRRRDPHARPARHEGLLQQARGDGARRSTPRAGSTPATSASCDDGFLAITDRKKDIIVTAGGKNIAPQPIENRVKTNKYVSQAVMIGDKRKFPVMLVVPNCDQLEKWATHQEHRVWTDRAQLLHMPTRAGEDGEGSARRGSRSSRTSRSRRRSCCSSTTSRSRAASSRRRSRSSGARWTGSFAR